MGTCDSCGRENEETVTVRRVYLILPEGAAQGDPDTLHERAEPRPQDESEQWCASCRDHFPHLLV